MSELWERSLWECTRHLPSCLSAGLLGWVGVGIVQSRNFDILDKSPKTALLCPIICCCLGAAYNRKKVRSHYKIKGSFLFDCFLYLLPLCGCAASQEHREICHRKSKELVKNPNQAITNIVNTGFLKRPVSSQSALEDSFSLEIDNESVAVGPLNINEYSSRSEIEDESSPLKSESISFNNPQSSENIPTFSYQKSTSVSDLKKEIDFVHKSPLDSLVEDRNETEYIQDRIEDLAMCEIALVPLDGEDPLVYSLEVGTSPLSFVRGQSFSADSPPPTYFSLEDLQAPKPVESVQIMGKLSPYKGGGLVCSDKEVLKRQSGVVKDLLKQVVRNIKQGLGVLSVTLPVRIFEPRSAVDRIIDKLSFIPVYINRAAETKDFAERITYVMCALISGLHLGVAQEKPFNPLLGETFQGHFPDGTLIYVEHISHHPPIDSIDIIAKNFRMWGSIELGGTFNWNFNALIGEFRGFLNILFADGQLISYSQPKFRLGGMIAGERTLNYEGEIEFKDTVNGLYGAIRIGDDKKKWSKLKNMTKDEFVGKVWKFDYQNNQFKDELYTVKGSWLRDFIVETTPGNERVLWKIDRDLPIRHLPADNALPSDWRYREDIIWLKRENVDYAGKWKFRLELRQRDDKLLRNYK